MSEDSVYCRDCGSEISPRAEICPECGIRQQPPETSENDSMSAGIAAVASFIIPGLGQVFNGEIGKGIVLGIVIVLTAITGVGLIIAIPLWIWAVYDAYRTADGGDDSDVSRNEAAEKADVQRANMAVITALEWFESEHSGTKTTQVRQRYQNVSSVSALTDEELTHIIDAIDAYQKEVKSKPVLSDARRAFISELD